MDGRFPNAYSRFHKTSCVNQGSLYPALHRLEHRGWIKAERGISELGRRARFYSLTASGRKQLEIEAENWSKLSDAIARVLRMA